MQLLRGVDHHKDQTYFLASVQPEALRRVLFPVGLFSCLRVFLLSYPSPRGHPGTPVHEWRRTGSVAA